MNMNWHRFTGVAILTIMVLLTLMMGPGASAQTTTATLTGTATDASGAVVPKAQINLKNEASGDARHTVSNGEGYFTFAAVPPGSYTLSVTMTGFKTWQATSIILNASDNRNVSNISLEPGGSSEVVSVEATSTQVTPVDSGEKSFLISQKIMSNVAIVGQNAAEFIKIMPGMAYTGSTLNTASYAAQDERTGNGPVGSFSANGQRTAALDITSDGAHIIDPGCNCGQAMNTNQDMTQELQVMTSNFGADESKGPITITAIGKSGGNSFHGEAYTYARYYSLNANDWLYNSKGNFADGSPVLPKPQTKYFYPGFNIGGPVLIPGTSFNKNHDKLFFFFGTEYYKQNVDNGVYQAVVPTQAMRNGDFTQMLAGKPYIQWLNGSSITGTPNNGGPTSNAFTAGKVNPGAINPNGLALMNTYPLDNLDPSLPQSQGFNYVNGQTRFSNMLQLRGRVDYNISDSTKLYVSYNHQQDNAEESLDTLWTGNGQSWASPTTPYPTPIVESTKSDVVSVNMTKVINPTLTNEVIFSYTYLNLPNHFQDPSKADRTGLGLNYSMLFTHPNEGNLIMPEMTGWGDGISNVLNTGFELNGVVYAKKTLPSVADNVVKVWGTHTTKMGFYWERAWNSQPGNGPVNGSAVFSSWGGGSTGNAYADMLIGQTSQYSEQNFDTVPAFRYISTEFYGTDSWKVSRHLTLDYGLRVSHLGPWKDTTGSGFAAWYPSDYAKDVGGSIGTALFPGIEWNKVNASTPISGSGSRLFFYEPRVGFAWDVFGSGRTVLRGGYGMYRFHDEQNVQNGAYSITQGAFSSPTQNGVNFANLAPVTSISAPSSITALDPTDTEQPRTQSYSFSVDERLPWKSLLEVSYVGNKSDYLSNWNNNFDQINDLGVGTLFAAKGWLPDCYPTGNPANDGGACSAGGADTGFNSADTQNARPLQSGPCVAALNCLGTVKVIDHKMYSNYNAMQVSLNKQSGPLNFMANYTFSKVLGIRGEGGAGTGDPTNLRNNYGTLPSNRTNIFNIATSYELPSMATGNSFVKQAVNGWEMSGIVQYQTGSDIQEAIGAYNLNYSAFIPGGTTFMGKTITEPIQASAQNVLGSPDITLMPSLTCDPRKGLAKNQFINGACFSPFATPGQQGSYVFPAMSGPGFFDADLTLFKNFTWGKSDSQKLRLEFSGYNFLNHPVRTFIKGDPGLNLSFDKTGAAIANGGTPFGFAMNKTGHRIVQAAIKYSF
jgi:hypothetical protein